MTARGARCFVLRDRGDEELYAAVTVVLASCGARYVTVPAGGANSAITDLIDILATGDAVVALLSSHAEARQVHSEIAAMQVVGLPFIVVRDPKAELPFDLVEHRVATVKRSAPAHRELTTTIRRLFENAPPHSARARVVATVQRVGLDHVDVTVNGNDEALLLRHEYSWVYTPRDFRKVLHRGDQLRGWTYYDTRGRRRFTQLDPAADPWPEIEADFGDGKEFVGEVVADTPRVGLFVRLRHGVNGLVPASLLPKDHPRLGSRVEAYVVRIDPIAREVELRLTGRIHVPPPAPITVENGTRHRAHVRHVSANRDYVLVQLDDVDAPLAMLHMRWMSPSSRDLLISGSLVPGNEVQVIVTAVDEARGRIEVRDDPVSVEVFDKDLAKLGLAPSLRATVELELLRACEEIAEHVARSSAPSATTAEGPPGGLVEPWEVRARDFLAATDQLRRRLRRPWPVVSSADLASVYLRAKELLDELRPVAAPREPLSYDLYGDDW